MAFLISDDAKTLELMITTVAAALTPWAAFKFRDHRAKRPKSPQEALYQYYENYINRLESQLEKKDIIITAQADQIKLQAKSIDDLQDQLNEQRELLFERQQQIDGLKKDFGNMKDNNLKAHQHLEKLKKDVPGLTDK